MLSGLRLGWFLVLMLVMFCVVFRYFVVGILCYSVCVWLCWEYWWCGVCCVVVVFLFWRSCCWWSNGFWCGWMLVWIVGFYGCLWSCCLCVGSWLFFFICFMFWWWLGGWFCCYWLGGGGRLRLGCGVLWLELVWGSVFMCLGIGGWYFFGRIILVFSGVVWRCCVVLVWLCVVGGFGCRLMLGWSFNCCWIFVSDLFWGVCVMFWYWLLGFRWCCLLGWCVVWNGWYCVGWIGWCGIWLGCGIGVFFCCSYCLGYYVVLLLVCCWGCCIVWSIVCGDYWFLGCWCCRG